MNMNLQTLKGFRDFLPKEARKRAFVLETLKKVFESYGFEPLETPALEYEEVLTGKYGEEGEKLMYKFEDLGGRKVALRYDQTVPLARVVAQYGNDLPLPFKRYQIQPVWRAENTQKGRYREFLQVDVDTVGASSLLADAEIISVAAKCLDKLGFRKYKILINDRNIFGEKYFKTSFDIPIQTVPFVIRAIDKIKKIGKSGVLDELTRSGFTSEQAEEILQRVDEAKPSPALEENIFTTLENLGVSSERFEFSPILARGLDYYTQMIFEIEIEDYEGGSLGGGGRYDNLIGLFANKIIPAVGFAFGFDRLIEAMDELKLFPKDLDGTKILVTNTNERSAKIADELRNKGINTELYVDDKELDKQLRYADRRGIPYVLFFDKDKLILKNMKSGDQKEVTIDSLPDAIR